MIPNSISPRAEQDDRDPQGSVGRAGRIGLSPHSHLAAAATACGSSRPSSGPLVPACSTPPTLLGQSLELLPLPSAPRGLLGPGPASSGHLGTWARHPRDHALPCQPSSLPGAGWLSHAQPPTAWLQPPQLPRPRGLTRGLRSSFHCRLTGTRALSACASDLPSRPQAVRETHTGLPRVTRLMYSSAAPKQRRGPA